MTAIIDANDQFRGLKTFQVKYVKAKRPPTTADIRDPKTGRLFELNTHWVLGKNPSSGTEGDIYILKKIVAAVATWELLSSAAPQVVGLLDNAGAQIVGDGSGDLRINGLTVANAANGRALYFKKLSASIEEAQIQLSVAQTVPANSNSAGVSSYDDRSFLVDANGWTSSKTGIAPGTSNIGISFAAGVFTVKGANGADLSAANPGYVTINSVNIPGRLVTIPITANQTFQDSAGTSQLAGNSFGVTSTGGAYTQDLPFFLYAVANSAQAGAGNPETAIAFMISRFPNANQTPVAAKIAIAGSAVAASQGSFYSMTGAAANYASSAALSIGSFRMRATAAIAAWTVQALAPQDGIGLGHFQEGVAFVKVAGTFGAATSSMFYANTGTAPIFTTQDCVFYIDMDNNITSVTSCRACTTAGVGAVNLQYALPYSINGTTTGTTVFSATASTLIGATNVEPNGPNNKQVIYATSGAANLLTVKNADVVVDANLTINLLCRGVILYS